MSSNICKILTKKNNQFLEKQFALPLTDFYIFSFLFSALIYCHLQRSLNKILTKQEQSSDNQEQPSKILTKNEQSIF